LLPKTPKPLFPLFNSSLEIIFNLNMSDIDEDFPSQEIIMTLKKSSSTSTLKWKMQMMRVKMSSLSIARA
jgi:hypothetical protein